MGTHPIFESDFDCLTDLMLRIVGRKKSIFSKSAENLPSKDTRPWWGKLTNRETGLFRKKEASVPYRHVHGPHDLINHKELTMPKTQKAVWYGIFFWIFACRIIWKETTTPGGYLQDSWLAGLTFLGNTRRRSRLEMTQVKKILAAIMEFEAEEETFYAQHPDLLEFREVQYYNITTPAEGSVHFPIERVRIPLLGDDAKQKAPDYRLPVGVEKLQHRF